MSRFSSRTFPLSRRRRARVTRMHSEESRDEGTGGPAGIVLPLNMVGAGMYEAIYTTTVLVGSNSQNLSLQVDTGSSDLWIASISCSSTACAGTKGRLYDPSVSGVATQSEFSIQYLAGRVSGPIYWDEVQVGGYAINNQALAAATSVDSEPLEHEFNGILGLALPLNSLIAHSITPVIGNGRDGAPFSSNLLGITPANSAPSSRFFSLSLSRPGSSAIPSLLGIGRHPSQLVPDPSKIMYSTVVPQNNSILFWEVEVPAITVYVNGSVLSVNIDGPRSGNVFPTAVLDSGVPFILASTHVANGIYGALGIGPAADGQYYVPCTTPLNMTITIDGQPEMPLHPLDLTARSQTDPSSSTCVGLIQTAGGIMDTSPTVSDMILGVPFLRNVYTVMAYDVPDARGIFPNNSTSGAADLLHPRVGLLSLTDPTRAMQEFDNVRVHNVPLSSGNPSSDQKAISSNKGKLSVGIDVLLVLVGVIGACFALFGLRWFLVRRRLRQGSYLDAADPKHDGASTAYPLGYRTEYLSIDSAPPRISLGRSIAGNSTLTVIGQDDTALGEFGFRSFKDKDNGDDGEPEVSYLNLDPGESCVWRDTLVGSTVDFPKSPDPTSAFEAAVLMSEPISSTHDATLAASLAAGLPMHRHTASDISTGPDGAGMAEPLLAHMEHAHHGSTDSIVRSDDDDLAEFGAPRESMAGIGTAGRSPRLRAQHGSGEGSFGSLMSMSLQPAVDPAPRVGLGPYFMTIAPGEQVSAYSLTEAARGNAIPQPLPPPSPPPP